MTTTLRLLDTAAWGDREIKGDRVRTLLAALVEAGSDGVGVRRLEETLWPDDPPADPRKALQVIVSRTRKLTAVNAAEHLGSRYRCSLETDQVDAWHLRHQARAARRAAAAQDWTSAGQLAAEVIATVVGEAESGVLGALRHSAREDIESCKGILGEAASRLGDHRRAVSILRPLVEGPTPPEPLLEVYLRSVSKTAGTAEALRIYDTYRRGLIEHLGTSPGEGLRALHAQFLALEDPQRSGVQYDDTDLIGRGADIAALHELTRTTRVVTILGPGGLGKTRLAHVVGRGATQPVVYFIELAGVVAGDGVLPTLASAVGVRESTTNRPVRAQLADLRTRLVDRLGSAPTLLILDNCEQVIDAVADLVATVVTQVQPLTVLVTSRTALGIRAERVYALPQLGHDDAVTLFRDRARAARPGVELDDDVIGPLVDRLDGLPLAIELAAARVRAMSVAAIAERLDQRFALLRGSARGVPARHQTLQAVIEWSWNLLEATDRDALTALSAFHDGFDLAGAEWLIGQEALARVESLVSQSLLTVIEDDGVRYRMLETVREFSRDQLELTGHRPTAEHDVREWALHVGRHAAETIYGPDQIAAIEELIRHQGNLSAELDRAIAVEDSTVAAVVGMALITLWQITGNFLRAVDTGDAAAAVVVRHPVPNGDRDAARALLATVAVFQRLLRGTSDQTLIDALSHLGTSTDPRTAGFMQVAVAIADVADDEPSVARDRLRLLATSAERGVALPAAQLCAHLEENSGDLDAALRSIDIALSRSDDALDGPWGSHSQRAERAGLLLQSGRRMEAAKDAELAIEVLTRLHASQDATQLRLVIALGAIDAGDPATAQAQFLALDVGEDRPVVLPEWGLLDQTRGELALQQGDRAAAVRLHRIGWQRMEALSLPMRESLGRTLPWLLFGRAVHLHSMALSERAGVPSEASQAAYADAVTAVLEALAAPLGELDHPSAGALVFAVGRWALVHLPDLVDVGAELMVLANASGYNQMYPSMDWDRAVLDIGQTQPGLLDRVRPAVSPTATDRLNRLRELAGRLQATNAGHAPG